MSFYTTQYSLEILVLISSELTEGKESVNRELLVPWEMTNDYQ